MNPKHPGLKQVSDRIEDGQPDWIIEDWTPARVLPPEDIAQIEPLPMPTLANAMKFERAHQEITLDELSKKIGVNRSTLATIEKGHIPKVPVFIKLMLWLGVIHHETATRLAHYAKEKTNEERRSD